MEPPFDGGEPGPAVGEEEPTILEQTRRAGMILGGDRPEQAARLLQPLVGHPRVVGDATGARSSKLLEDVLDGVEGEPLGVSEAAGDLGQDPPVRPCLPGGSAARWRRTILPRRSW